MVADVVGDQRAVQHPHEPFAHGVGRSEHLLEAGAHALRSSRVSLTSKKIT
jgi:hypothetical protein